MPETPYHDDLSPDSRSQGDPEEADVARKRETLPEPDSPSKKARTSMQTTPVPDEGPGELLIDDAYIAEIDHKLLPECCRMQPQATFGQPEPQA